MTTIAYRDGVLAGDGKVCSADTVLSTTERKVHRLRDGRLFGFAGRVDDGVRLKLALQKGEAPPEIAEEFQAIQVHTDGTIELYEHSVWQRVNERYYAIGSGGPLALIAMDCDCDARQAVIKASKRDLQSGGTVRTVKLK